MPNELDQYELLTVHALYVMRFVEMLNKNIHTRHDAVYFLSAI